MFGSKGRSGKTTFSAATAYYLAEQGHRTLGFSFDPQALLSDIFQRDTFGKGAVEIMPNLLAQDIGATNASETIWTKYGKRSRTCMAWRRFPKR